ncbi:MAG: D-ribose pyranase, partial [Alkalibacterium sp.]|nr:D-ribose pyranase [Alkalibacterium sp.]
MKKNGILNSEISKIFADLGHTDQIMIADVGLPIPEGIKKIDLAVELGKPKFSDVLSVILKEMEVEKYILANEIQDSNQEQLKNIKKYLNNIEVE